MSKRFFDTEMILNPWYRKLPPHMKCLWHHLLARCDMAGVVDMDWELASFSIGKQVTAADISMMEGNAVILANGKLFLPKFIHFQYGELTDDPKHRVHQAVLKVLAIHQIPYPYSIDTLSGVLDTPKDKDKEKDKDKKKEKEERKVYGELHKVLLTDTEYSKLQADHSHAELAKGIEILDTYIASKNPKYASHYAVMKADSWVWERVRGTQGKAITPVDCKVEQGKTNLKAVLQ